MTINGTNYAKKKKALQCPGGGGGWEGQRWKEGTVHATSSCRATAMGDVTLISFRYKKDTEKCPQTMGQSRMEHLGPVTQLTSQHPHPPTPVMNNVAG